MSTPTTQVEISVPVMTKYRWASLASSRGPFAMVLLIVSTNFLSRAMDQDARFWLAIILGVLAFAFVIASFRAERRLAATAHSRLIEGFRQETGLDIPEDELTTNPRHQKPVTITEHDGTQREWNITTTKMGYSATAAI
jgi:hypothetical protein